MSTHSLVPGIHFFVSFLFILSEHNPYHQKELFFSLWGISFPRQPEDDNKHNPPSSMAYPCYICFTLHLYEPRLAINLLKSDSLLYVISNILIISNQNISITPDLSNLYFLFTYSLLTISRNITLLLLL